MSKLIGLAFTSPGIAVLAINRETYRVYYHDQSSLTDFRLFLDQVDDRIPVVFLKSVRDLAELKPIGEGSVQSWVLFEDPKVLSHIEGAILPDFQRDTITEWAKITITQEHFNNLLSSKAESFNITEKAIKSSSLMTTPITFLELVKMVNDYFIELKQDYSEFNIWACKYVTKLISKKTWIASARKPALASGIPIKTLAELEKSMETSKTSDEIWRAFYDFSVNSINVDELVNKYAVALDDIEFIIKTLQAEPGQNLEFTSAPGVAKRKKTKAALK